MNLYFIHTEQNLITGYLSNLKRISNRELNKTKSLRINETSLSEVSQAFRASLNSIQEGMTEGYLSLVSNRESGKSKSIAQLSQGAAITLAVMILNVEQISDLESLLPTNTINEVKKLPIQFFENLEKLLNSDRIETVFNELDSTLKTYSNKIEEAILRVDIN